MKSPLEMTYHKFDHPANFAVSLNDNQDVLYFDVEDDLVEWESNICTFVSDFFITFTHHHQRVVVEIGLCSCPKLSNNRFVPVFLTGAVILVYCLRWDTIQSSMYLNVFSSIGGKWWPGLVVFKVSGTNKTTLSIEIFMLSKLKHWIVWFLWPVAKHKNITKLWESFLRSQSVRAGFDLIKVKTSVTSQVVTYLGKAWLIFKTPLRSLYTGIKLEIAY